MSDILTEDEIGQLGFLSVGKDVRISRFARFYAPEKISIGNHVRIDDFCVLSGKITIGNYIHIAVYSAIFGGEAGVTLNDFCNISSRVSIYALSDDYSGETMTNPMILDKYKNVEQKPVLLGKHVIVGSGCVILPGAYLAEGASFGALSLIKGETEAWSINVGIPSRKIKERSNKLLTLEEEFIKNEGEKNA